MGYFPKHSVHEDAFTCFIPEFLPDQRTRLVTAFFTYWNQVERQFGPNVKAQSLASVLRTETQFEHFPDMNQ